MKIAASNVLSIAMITEKRLGQSDVTDEFKGNVEEFICPICENVLEDMDCCAECEALFCRECIQSWLKKKADCPCC